MPSVFYEQRVENLFIGDICEYPFPAHVHDAVEILCLATGNVEMTISGKLYSVRPGDIAVVFPSVTHSYEKVSSDASGLSVILLPDTIAELSNSFRGAIPSLPLIPAKQKPAELNMIMQRLREISGQTENPLLLAYLHLFLAHIFMALNLNPLSNRMQSGLTQQVLHYISEHFTEPLSLDSTSKALSISRSHLSHIFSQQLNINFREYINTLRIDRACSLLRDPFYSISQIAYLCGYGNPRTFHRAFLSKHGMAPNQYRASLSGQISTEEPEYSDS